MQFYYLLLTQYALKSAANFMQEHINPWWNADFGPLSH